MQRLCPDLYHAKLQTALGLNYSAAAAHGSVPFENGTATHGSVLFEDGTDEVSIGTDSMMMMDEGEIPLANGVEALQRSNGHPSQQDVATLGASQLPPNHTCCSTRAQLCTMSLQQVNRQIAICIFCPALNGCQLLLVVFHASYH